MLSILCIGSWFYLIAVYLQCLLRSHPYFHYQCFGMFITFELIVSMCTYATVIWGAWLPVYSSHHWVFFCLDMSTSRQQLMVCNAKIHRLFSLLYIFHMFLLSDWSIQIWHESMAKLTETKHSHQRSWRRREKQRGNWGEWIWLSSLPFPHNRVFVWFCLFRFSLHR